MAAFYPFPSIENGRTIVDKVVETCMPDGVDTCKIEGTIKIHGTCAAIVKHDSNGPITFQSRSRIITTDDDNASFAATMLKNMVHVERMFSEIEQLNNGVYPIIVYGEWCGKGIQKNVAINKVEKCFVIFKIVLGRDQDGGWVNMDDYAHILAPPIIRNIREVPVYTFILNKGSVKEDLETINEVVKKIDTQCPFSQQLFHADGHGEGLVLKPKLLHSSDYWWKQKGESHQLTRPKTQLLDLNNRDSHRVENEFALQFVTFERLLSAKEALHISTTTKDIKEIMKHFSKIAGWIVEDIRREETFDEKDESATRRAITARVRELLLA